MSVLQTDARLDAVRSAGGFAADVVERFATHLRDAPDEDLFRMSPYRYADASGTAPRVAVDLFLHATHAGLLEFSWGVLCPGCGAFLTTPGALRSLEANRDCKLCRLSIVSSVDDNIEVAFTVAPSTRRLRFHGVSPAEHVDFTNDGARVYLSSSVVPSNGFRVAVSEGLVWKARLPANGTVAADLTLEAGRYVLIVPHQHAVVHVTVAEGGSTDPIELDVVAGRFLPDGARLAPGAQRLVIRNRLAEDFLVALLHDFTPTDEDRACIVEIPRLQLTRFLTGKELVTSQVFRELFRTESIPSEGGLELKNLTVLFTDLKGSTEMYHRIGDMRAYDLVRRHFGVLRKLVAERGGAVVKTIGDAIMASFAESAPALEAAVAMNREVGRLADDLSLKIGLHAGPCIAVELNERLDYFGQTVNLAARVQGAAGAREIVCTEPVLSAPGASHVLEAASLRARRDRAVLKGIEGEVTLYRIGGSDGDSPPAA